MIFDKIEKSRLSKGYFCFALIDPDIKNDKILQDLIDKINCSNFDGILVGGSLIQDSNFDKRIKYIKQNSELPVLIFPGSSNQISKHADGILYLNLISGRNPQYLIDEQVKSAPIIYNLKIEPIPTAYILLESNYKTGVEIISNTKPLPMDHVEIILAHALAGEFMGNKLIFFDCGSGADKTVAKDVIQIIKKYVKIPIMVGGGITDNENLKDLISAGADYIVIGTALEKMPTEYIKNMMNVI